MKECIQTVFSESENTYGSRRHQGSLERARDQHLKAPISRLMKEEDEWSPKQVSKWHPQTTQADEKHDISTQSAEIRTSVAEGSQSINGWWIFTYIADQRRLSSI
jgi:hypothetical protein